MPDAGTEDGWMQALAAGDQSAARALMEAHLSRTVAVAYRILLTREEAEDVAQEAFLRLWRNAAAWEPGRARVSTWLHRVTVNLCYDRLRKRRETGVEDLSHVPDDRPHPDEGLAAEDVSRRVRKALRELPERQRAALVLCHYEGHSNAEAGEILGVSAEAVESLLARARRKLKTLLARDAAEYLEHG